MPLLSLDFFFWLTGFLFFESGTKLGVNFNPELSQFHLIFPRHEGVGFEDYYVCMSSVEIHGGWEKIKTKCSSREPKKTTCNTKSFFSNLLCLIVLYSFYINNNSTSSYINLFHFIWLMSSIIGTWSQYTLRQAREWSRPWDAGSLGLLHSITLSYIASRLSALHEPYISTTAQASIPRTCTLWSCVCGDRRGFTRYRDSQIEKRPERWFW